MARIFFDLTCWLVAVYGLSGLWCFHTQLGRGASKDRKTRKAIPSYFPWSGSNNNKAKGRGTHPRNSIESEEVDGFEQLVACWFLS